MRKTTHIPDPRSRRMQPAAPRGRRRGRTAKPGAIPGVRVRTGRNLLLGGGAVLAGALLIAAACLGLARCIDDRQAAPPEPNPPYVSPYDWSNLKWEGERATYFENGHPTSRFGIDVSVHQREIDWPAVASDGVEFAFVRIGYRGYTEGVLHVDDCFETNFAGARNSGIDVGVYFFSQAITPEEAAEEADFVIAQLNGRPVDLPIVFDHEPVGDAQGRANGISSETLTACTAAFCQRLEEAGYRTMVYGNADCIAMSRKALSDQRPVWLAEYHALTPSAQFDFQIWQYSCTGSVAGISTDVDLNIMMPDAP